MIGKPKGYWNGDGIATERDVSNVTIRNVAVLDNTDAGLDLKSSTTVSTTSMPRATSATFACGATRERGRSRSAR
ncbi:hypothetical protein AB5I41_17450 [Sphingomonas sp. MMS24-JH45]